MQNPTAERAAVLKAAAERVQEARGAPKSVKYVFCARDRCTKCKGKATQCRGVLTGGLRECLLEGCRGQRLGVRWVAGRITWPCTRGMKLLKKGWQIL